MDKGTAVPRSAFRRFAGSVVFSTVAVVLGCDASSERVSLIGEWQSDESPSQFGTVVTRVRFGEDGTYSSTVTFIDAPLPSRTVDGTYQLEGHSILATAAGRKHSIRFSFEGEVLVLTEGSDVFRVRRQ